MSSTHSMNARKCVHALKPNPSQAFAHESSKVGGRGKREEENRKDRGQEADGKKGSPTKLSLSEELKKAYLGTDRLTKQGE